MRKRLVVAGILGLGVPLLAAWFTRRDKTGEAAATEPMPAEPATEPARRPPHRRANEHILEPHPTGIFAAIGRFDYRFRKLLPVLGLVLVIGLQLWAKADGGKLIQGGWVISGSEEQAATELLADRFGEQATTMLVVYRDPAGDAKSPAFQAESPSM